MVPAENTNSLSHKPSYNGLYKVNEIAKNGVMGYVLMLFVLWFKYITYLQVECCRLTCVMSCFM